MNAGLVAGAGGLIGDGVGRPVPSAVEGLVPTGVEGPVPSAVEAPVPIAVEGLVSDAVGGLVPGAVEGDCAASGAEEDSEPAGVGSFAAGIGGSMVRISRSLLKLYANGFLQGAQRAKFLRSRKGQRAPA